MDCEFNCDRNDLSGRSREGKKINWKNGRKFIKLREKNKKYWNRKNLSKI